MLAWSTFASSTAMLSAWSVERVECRATWNERPTSDMMTTEKITTATMISTSVNPAS